MKKIGTEQLNEILENHKKWLYNEGGERADLHDTDLKEFILRGVDLRKANLQGANLFKANLEGANLSEANLEYADLRRACLEKTNLSESNLSKTDCTYANLRNASLIYANLREAFLTGANLNRANLVGASLSGVKYDETTSFFALQCPEKGSFIGYKKAGYPKAGYRIVELLITEDSLRSSATSRKCRCSKAKVLSITDFNNTENFDMVASSYDENFIYKVGEIVEVEDFDENRWNECSTGIHFFITRQEAINY